MTQPVGPSGAGGWIAFPRMLGGYKAAIPLLKACGFQWLAPRAGQGGTSDPTFTKEDAEALIAAGFKLYPWVFSKPKEWRGELLIYKKVMDWGCHGVICDAEILWEQGDNHGVALDFMNAFDKELPDVFLADAPWPWIAYHPNFPTAEFAQRVNVRMPQLYWTEINNQGAAKVIAETKKQWAAWEAKHPTLVRPIWPIGITYGRDEMAKWGSQQLPPGTFKREDLQVFLDTYDQAPFSVYSVEASAVSAIACLKDNVRTVENPPSFSDDEISSVEAEMRSWDAARKDWLDGEDARDYYAGRSGAFDEKYKGIV